MDRVKQKNAELQRPEHSYFFSMNLRSFLELLSILVLQIDSALSKSPYEAYPAFTAFLSCSIFGPNPSLHSNKLVQPTLLSLVHHILVNFPSSAIFFVLKNELYLVSVKAKYNFLYVEVTLPKHGHICEHMLALTTSPNLSSISFILMKASQA